MIFIVAQRAFQTIVVAQLEILGDDATDVNNVKRLPTLRVSQKLIVCFHRSANAVRYENAIPNIIALKKQREKYWCFEARENCGQRDLVGIRRAMDGEICCAKIANESSFSPKVVSGKGDNDHHDVAKNICHGVDPKKNFFHVDGFIVKLVVGQNGIHYGVERMIRWCDVTRYRRFFVFIFAIASRDSGFCFSLNQSRHSL